MPTTYEPIATTTLGSAALTITFSSIASSWTDLKLVFSGTTTVAGYLAIQFNADTGTNYSVTSLYGTGASASSFAISSATEVNLSGISTTSTTLPFFVHTDVFSYAGSTNKTILTGFHMDKNGSGGIERSVGLWRNTAAITSIKLIISNDPTITFAVGTTATLYGIKNA
jgi:hypothetical protein